MESSVVRSSAGSKSICAPPARSTASSASNSSVARASAGAAVKLSGCHCAAIAPSLTNASRGCLTSTRVRRPTSDSVLSRTPLQDVDALHRHDNLPPLVQYLEERWHQAAIRLRRGGARLAHGGAHRQRVAGSTRLRT